MRGFYSILFLLIVHVVHAQQVPTLLNNEGIGGNSYDQISSRVVETNDGGFILALYTSSTNGNILCDTTPVPSVFRKYNSDGTILEWTKCHSGDVDSAFDYLFQAMDGNFILGGHSFTNTSRDFLIRKEDANGNILWGSKRYGGSAGELLRDMASCPDGGYIMLGISNSDDGDVGMHYGGVFNNDIWALKVDSNGEKQWSTVLGGSDDEEALCVVTTPGNNAYVIGASYSTDYDCTDNHGSKDVFVARLDDSGHILWHHCYGGSNKEGYPSGWAVSDGHGGILVATCSSSTDGDVQNHFGGSDIWLLDIDSSGQLVWNKSYGGSNYDVAKAITKATDGTLWIGGESTSTDGEVSNNYGNGDAWIVHTDSVGNLLSAKVLGAAEEDAATMLQALPGSIVMVGGTYSAAGGELPAQYWGATDIFLARLAPWTTGVPTAAKAMADDEIKVWPNPAKDNIHINWQGTGSCLVDILDMTGRTMYEGKDVGKGTSISTETWARGLYYVLVRDADGNTLMGKALIE